MSGSSCCKKTHREPEERRALINRLSRIEGQIRGLKAMVEEDAYCNDILTQSAAAAAAMAAFNRLVADHHLRTCVARDLKAGEEASLEELAATLQKLMR